MDIHPKYRSAFGYQTGGGGVDSYGVDHSNFSLRDEIKYQTDRVNKENRLKNYYNNQGITKNYPQYGSDFWKAAEKSGGADSLGSDSEFSVSNNNFGKNSLSNQTNTSWNGEDDLSMYPQNNTTPQVDYSLYGDGFSKEFIDKMLVDKPFQRALRRTAFNEGGYVNHPNDRGGETNYGISSKVYPNEDIKNLTPERAKAIYYRDYWLKPQINKLPQELSYMVFDDGVVQGQPTAIRNLQRAIGVTADGIIGPQTLNALQGVNYDIIRTNFKNNANHIEDLYLQKDPSQKVFERGHRDRFNRY